MRCCRGLHALRGACIDSVCFLGGNRLTTRIGSRNDRDYDRGTRGPEGCKGDLAGGIQVLLKIPREHGVQMRYQPMIEEEIDRAVTL